MNNDKHRFWHLSQPLMSRNDRVRLTWLNQGETREKQSLAHGFFDLETLRDVY